MDFPKAPKHAVRGVLRLVVRDPKTQATTEDTPPAPLGEEVSDSLKIKLPSWFTVDSNAGEVLKRQRDAATQQIKGLREKRDRCALCKKRTSVAALDAAEHVVNQAASLLADSVNNTIKLIIYQDPQGWIGLSSCLQPRTIEFRFYAGGVEAAGYQNDSWVFSTNYRHATSDSTIRLLKWLAGEDIDVDKL